MKREEDFISSIYEKRDAAVEKRRRTVRLVRRAGMSIASLFAVAVIIVAALPGSGGSLDKTSSPAEEMYFDGDAADKSLQDNENGRQQTECASKHEAAPETDLPTEEPAYEGGDGNTDAPATAAASSAAFGTVSGADVKAEGGSTAAFTEAWTYAGIAVEKQRLETVPADGEENEKRDLEKMLTLFGLWGESLEGGMAGSGKESAEVHRVFTSKGTVFIFRYKDFYCCVADPDPALSPEKAISLADEAISKLSGNDGTSAQ